MNIKTRSQISFILVSLFVTFSFNEIVAQSPTDSLKIYNPYTNGEDIRRIIRDDFSLVAKNDLLLIEQYSEQIQLSQINNSINDEANAFLKLAEIYFKAGLFEKALKNYFSALKIYEGTDNIIQAAKVEIYIGRTYYFADLKPQKDYLTKGVQTLQNSNDPELLAFAYYAQAYLEKDSKIHQNLDNKALKIQLEVIKMKPDDLEANKNLSLYLNATGNLEGAIKVAEKIGDDWLLVLYLNNLGYRKVDEKKYEESLTIFFRSLDICIEKRFITLLRNTYDNISRTYRLDGELDKALFYSRYMHFVEERIYSDKFSEAISEARIKYESEKNEIENKLLKEEKEVFASNIAFEKAVKHSLLVIILLIFIIAIIIYRSRRKIKSAKLLLDNHHNEILVQKRALEALYKELKTNEEKLKFAQSTAKMASWEWDFIKKEFTFSEQFPIIFGIDEELVESNFNELIVESVHENDRQKFKEYYIENISNAKNIDVEYRIVSGKNIKWIKAKRIVIKDASGKNEKIFGTVQDITESKEKEKIKIEIAASESFAGKLILSQEEERKRISGELHDSLGQDILLIKNRAQLCLQNTELDAFTTGQLNEIGISVTGMLKMIREISLDLRPIHLDRIGLTETIISVIERVSDLGPINVSHSIPNIDKMFSSESEINLYRIIQEGLNNIIKHSEAKNAKIGIMINEHTLLLNITDNGKGIGLEVEIEKFAGFGLSNILQRVKILGGTLNIISKPNKGTKLEIKIPILENGK